MVIAAYPNRRLEHRNLSEIEGDASRSSRQPITSTTSPWRESATRERTNCHFSTANGNVGTTLASQMRKNKDKKTPRMGQRICPIDEGTHNRAST
ncbi:hypothetical protein M758_UG343000 [Ceratodon purpureus]|nr:hypothetical protein M758_UG343000 [Ceratodon purpureus]